VDFGTRPNIRGDTASFNKNLPNAMCSLGEAKSGGKEQK
jgi:hypothetical protein